MSRRRRSRDEAGLTLIELIATLGIMGVAFVVIIGGTITAVVGSVLHRNQATSETVLRNFAEAVKAEPYVNCATAASYGTDATFPDPSGFMAKVETRGQQTDPPQSPVGYWSSVTNDFDANCLVPADDQGLQKIVLKVQSTDRRNEETVEIVKRRPS